MLLDHGDGGELGKDRGKAFAVQRLESMDTYHSNAHAFFLFEAGSYIQGHLSDRTIGKQAKVLPFLEAADLTESKPVRSLRCQIWFSRLAEPEINWARQVDARARGSGRLGGVAWRDDSHVGQRAHHGDIFLCVMRAAERGVRHAAAYSDQLDGQVLVATIDPHHFKWPVDRKRGNRVGERDTTEQCQPRGQAHHYLLSDADVYEPLREFFLKSSGTG